MVTTLEQIDDELWEEACRREDVVRDLLRLHPHGASAVIAQAGFLDATAYFAEWARGRLS
jgi:hypothetical protein